MDSVSQILSTLSVSREKQLTAMSDILLAIQGYRSHLPPEIAQTRKQLEALLDSLVVTKKALGECAPQALIKFCEEIEAPFGLATQCIDKLISAAQSAFDEATKLPNKEPDIARKVLSGQIAIILDSLGVKPVVTRDTDENITGSHGGAAYARILRACLETAGDQPPRDLRPLMKSGLEQLCNPRGDECM